jgi:peptidoglycan/LPS O-acetylase OafA/YrhL
VSAWVALVVSVGVIAILCLAPLPDRTAQGLLDITSHRYGLTVIRCLPEFCLGLLSFRISSTAFGRYLRTSRFISPIICVAIVALLLFPKTDFFAVLLFPPLIISLASGSKHVPGRLLSSPFAELLGKLSYSIYLIHTLCSDIIPLVARTASSHGIPHGHAIGACAAFMVAFILAYLSHKYIEVPGRRFFRRLFEGGESASKRMTVSLPSS